MWVSLHPFRLGMKYVSELKCGAHICWTFFPLLKIQIHIHLNLFHMFVLHFLIYYNCPSQYILRLSILSTPILTLKHLCWIVSGGFPGILQSSACWGPSSPGWSEQSQLECPIQNLSLSGTGSLSLASYSQWKRTFSRQLNQFNCMITMKMDSHGHFCLLVLQASYLLKRLRPMRYWRLCTTSLLKGGESQLCRLSLW